MNLRVPLFTRIFIGFWLATIAVLGSWMLATQYFDSNPDGASVETPPPGPPPRFMLRMVYDLQNLDDTELQALITEADREHGIEIFLLDRKGVDLFGRDVPESAQILARKLRGTRRRAFLKNGDTNLIAHQIYRPDRGMLRAVFVFPPPRHQLLDILGSSLWLRIGLAVLISGLVCLALSRLMTRRLKELQLASRQLATGDLDTRLQVRHKGGDETDELARDFNSMAGQLQERIQAQRRLLGDVSHELRSPLARLRIALALAQDNPEKTSIYLDRIERETERLEELIGQLLASQAQEGELDSHIDLVPLLQQLCADANFEGAAQDKRVVLNLKTSQAVVASSGDLLHKSLENILRNALIHTADNTAVEVTLEQSQDHYQVRVTDHGGGVPEPELEKIFDAFYRTDTARSSNTGGHGLGLAITRRAITRHGGRIWAANTGTGLAVTVTLPVPLLL